MLLLGHLVGDYILQNDYLAANKVLPTSKSQYPNGPLECGVDAWEDAKAVERKGDWACTVHCLLYTLAVWGTTFWWMPWWGLVVCFLAHWPIDRFRLARLWMTRVSGQAAFATGSLSPWSIIIVDNVGHLLTLAAIAALAGRVG